MIIWGNPYLIAIFYDRKTEQSYPVAEIHPPLGSLDGYDILILYNKKNNIYEWRSIEDGNLYII